jgi:hypothetical protein
MCSPIATVCNRDTWPLALYNDPVLQGGRSAWD